MNPSPLQLSKSEQAGAPATVLVLPGWQGSGPGHWQTRWEALCGWQRVPQHDWMRPLRGDWTVQLQEAVLAAPQPVLLVAHSLGCILAAWWAAHSPAARRVQGALLVAPPDIERTDLREQIPGWAPIARQPLPFAATLVASRNDPYCAWPVAQRLAADWGATLHDAGHAGHINADSGLGDWPAGLALVQALMAASVPARAPSRTGAA